MQIDVGSAGSGRMLELMLCYLSQLFVVLLASLPRDREIDGITFYNDQNCTFFSSSTIDSCANIQSTTHCRFPFSIYKINKKFAKARPKAPREFSFLSLLLLLPLFPRKCPSFHCYSLNGIRDVHFLF